MSFRRIFRNPRRFLRSTKPVQHAKTLLRKRIFRKHFVHKKAEACIMSASAFLFFGRQHSRRLRRCDFPCGGASQETNASRPAKGAEGRPQSPALRLIRPPNRIHRATRVQLIIQLPNVAVAGFDAVADDFRPVTDETFSNPLYTLLHLLQNAFVLQSLTYTVLHKTSSDMVTAFPCAIP